MPPASTAPSCWVSPVAVIRAPACRAASLDHGQVGGAELAGLIQHEHVVLVQRDGPAQLVGAFGLAEELGDVVALGQALMRQHPGRVGRGGQPDHPPASERGPQPGELRHRVALARPGRGDQHGRRGGGGEHRHHGVALLGVQPGAPGGRPGLPSLTSCGTVRFAAVRICSSVSRCASVEYRSSCGGR